MSGSSGGVWWEWLTEGSYQHDRTRIYCIPETDDTWGDIVTQDLKPPTIIYKFAAHGMSVSEFNAILAAQTRGSLFTVTDYLGNSFTGEVLSLTSKGESGLTIFDAELQLRI